MMPWWVSAKTHILVNIVHMIISMGTCSKHKAYTPYRSTYTSLHLLLVQWLETNVLHYWYASYWSEKKNPSPNAMGKMKKMNPL